MANDNDEFDEFGLSSGDEADMLALADGFEPRKTKRRSSNDSGPPCKRSAIQSRSYPSALQAFTKNFKMQAFRLKQEQVILRILDGESAVVVFPIGGGKSLCYQVPALVFAVEDKIADIRGEQNGGITLVVSPLISLVKGQVDALVRKGIKAATMNSSKSKEKYLASCDLLRNGELKLLYCAPERLNNEGFIEQMKFVQLFLKHSHFNLYNTTMSNGVSIEELVKHDDFDENDVERISFRKVHPSLDIVDPDPTWPSTYAIFASRIVAALGPPSSPNGAEPGTGHLVSVSHVGSTSVPELPAKAIIDIDVVVPHINDESAYVSALESQGFQFMLREPKWYSHRFFTAAEPMFANVHVWGPACPEAERHRIFKEWLIENVEDRELYARTKKECSEASKLGGESMQDYTYRKEGVIKDILHRAFKRFGYVE